MSVFLTLRSLHFLRNIKNQIGLLGTLLFRRACVSFIPVRKSWKVTIREDRRRLTRTFKDSPSFKVYFQEVWTECYQDARKQASDQTSLLLDTFAVDFPLTTDECLDKDFLPD
ncbi:DUF29 domain-containing protein [Nostoc sp. NMS8]|uniref:DUF29 domain-containing protein n=1 Tax=Nostoc sp. NMS8 TaxID=2815392 RepID=UPI0025F6AC2B|nr:DUF29 domain-containing protein [Nostoc sp. NMS8]